MTVTFGKNADNITATLSVVKVGAAPLTEGKDYTFVGNTITIKKENLATQKVGTVAISIQFSVGSEATLIITFADTTN